MKNPTLSRRIGCALLFTGLSIASLTALATPDEIQVYNDDMDDPGNFGLELHTNYTLDGSKTPSYAGEVPSHHVLQVTPELSYGISKTLEAGLYFPPMAIHSNGSVNENGMRFRLKYIAPHEADSTFYWGLNTEVGYSSIRIAENHWNAELRPIFGYRNAAWEFIVNPILGLTLSGTGSREPEFEPAIKISRALNGDTRLGIEHYASLGPLQHLLPASERSYTTYVTADTEIGKAEVNFGIGRGYGNTPDRWMAKMILGFSFR
ncbi:MAG: hypothetical protein K8F27_00725 [Sulfuricellaceae bacterium]|nr:hypothetical protein [Sulfuricellaceae bacterium]